MLVTFLELDIIEPNRSPEFEQASSALLPLDKIVSKLSVMWTVRDVRWFLEIMVTYEIVGVVNFIKLPTFSLPIRIIFVKSIPKLFSIKYFTTLLL